MKTIDTILLVDDDLSTNYLHRMVIEEYGLDAQVDEAHDGQEALDYLTTAIDGKFPKPDIIFLDINMPRMDGWEFLEAYGELAEECKGGVVIAMLTTSLNPDDKERAARYDCVKQFENKPLDVQKLDRLIQAALAE